MKKYKLMTTSQRQSMIYNQSKQATYLSSKLRYIQIADQILQNSNIVIIQSQLYQKFNLSAITVNVMPITRSSQTSRQPPSNNTLQQSNVFNYGINANNQLNNHGNNQANSQGNNIFNNRSINQPAQGSNNIFAANNSRPNSNLFNNQSDTSTTSTVTERNIPNNINNTSVSGSTRTQRYTPNNNTQNNENNNRSSNNNIFNGSNTQGNNLFNNTQGNNLLNSSQGNNLLNNNQLSNQNFFANQNTQTYSIFDPRNTIERLLNDLRNRFNTISDPDVRQTIEIWDTMDFPDFFDNYKSHVDFKKAICCLGIQTQNNDFVFWAQQLTSYLKDTSKDAEELTQRLLGNRYQPPPQSTGNSLFNYSNTSNIFTYNRTSTSTFSSNSNNSLFPEIRQLPIQLFSEPLTSTDEEYNRLLPRVQKIKQKNQELIMKLLGIKMILAQRFPKLILCNKPRSRECKEIDTQIRSLMSTLKQKIALAKHKIPKRTSKQQSQALLTQMIEQRVSEAKQNSVPVAMTQDEKYQLKEKTEKAQKCQKLHEKQRIKVMKTLADEIPTLQRQVRRQRHEVNEINLINEEENSSLAHKQQLNHPFNAF